MLFRKRGDDRPAHGAPGAPPDTSRRVPDGDPESLRVPGGGTSVIGPRTRIRGALRGEGSIVVQGSVQGEIAIRGGLTITPGATVEAEIEARSVALEGEARGSIQAQTLVAVSATGVFEGTLAAPVLDTRPGSVLRGKTRVAGIPARDRRGLSH